ncbi:MAG: hypothetical protein SFU98_11310 [Leptospiraceae bacterium]|nr:hypothetical protein [Leptospiraceae bacterium]
MFAGTFNLFWFKVRYSNFVYQKELEEQTKRRIKIENELAAQKEREAIFYNLHDHLGSAIVDLSMIVKSLSPMHYPEKEKLESIDYYLHEIEDNLRMQMNTIQDKKNLEKDFLFGIKNILFRRYAIYKRDVIVVMENISESNDSIFKDPIHNWSLYSLCMEICNNDLKYGSGSANWSWKRTGEEFLELEIQSNTNYHKNSHVTGKGNETIKQRLASLNGKMEVSHNHASFHSLITIPLNSD